MVTQALTLDMLRGEGREKGACKAGRLVRGLSPEDQTILNEALYSPEEDFPSSRIVSALAGLGIPVSKDSIIKHRRGLCRCETL